MFGQPVNRKLRKALISEYPALKDTRYMRMLEFLLYHRIEDADEESIPISHLMLKKIARIKPNGRFKSLPFLLSYKQIFPTFEFDEEYNFAQGKAREITNKGIPAKVYEIRNTYLYDEPEILLGTGRSIKESRQDYEALVQEAATVRASSEQVNAMVDYHNALPIKLFSQKFNENLPDAIRTLQALRLDDKKFQSQYSLLKKIAVLPKPVMVPTSTKEVTVKDKKTGEKVTYDQAGSARIFGQEPNVLGLKREVRKTLCKGWWELDLRSSQFHINAYLWDMPELDEWLDSHDVWEELTFGKKHLKQTVKTAVYTIFYGGGKDRIEEDWDTDELTVDQLLSHPIIALILDRRREFYKKISKEAPTCPLSGEKIYGHANQRAAKLAQAYEVKLIHRIYEYWQETEAGKDKNTTKWKIVLNQHDGLTISFRSERVINAAIKNITREVEELASALGLRATLEWTEL